MAEKKLELTEELARPIEIKPLNLAPSGPEEYGVTVSQIQAYLQALSTQGGANAGAVMKAAKDLEQAGEFMKKAVEDATKAKKIAEDMARFGGRAATVDERALKTIPLIYKPDGFSEFRGRFTPAQFNMLNLSRQHGDMNGLDEPVVNAIERFQYLNGVTAVMHSLMTAQAPGKVEQYYARGGIKSLPTYEPYQELARIFRAAMDTAESGAGSEWVPNGVGTSLIPDVRPEFAVTSFIQNIPMPRSPFVYPVQGNHFRGYLITEATSDTEASNPAFGRRDVQTLNVTLTARKIGAIVYHSRELEQDSIVALSAAIRGDLAYAIEASKESAWINGQRAAISGTSSTFDTGETFSNSAGEEDDREAWDGLRYFANLTGVIEDASGGLVAENLANVIGRMGKFGMQPNDLVWVTSYAGKARLLTLKSSTGTAVVLTREVAGPNATFETGVMGLIFGSRLLVSNEMSQAMNAAGIVDGTGNTTAILCFNRRRFVHGAVQLTEVEASREFRFNTDQIAVKATYRADGQDVRLPSATETSVGGIYAVAV
jgi:HK97 family phage major capsid protein